MHPSPSSRCPAVPVPCSASPKCTRDMAGKVLTNHSDPLGGFTFLDDFGYTLAFLLRLHFSTSHPLFTSTNCNEIAFRADELAGLRLQACIGGFTNCSYAFLCRHKTGVTESARRERCTSTAWCLRAPLRRISCTRATRSASLTTWPSSLAASTPTSFRNSTPGSCSASKVRDEWNILPSAGIC